MLYRYEGASISQRLVASITGYKHQILKEKEEDKETESKDEKDENKPKDKKSNKK